MAFFMQENGMCLRAAGDDDFCRGRTCATRGFGVTTFPSCWTRFVGKGLTGRGIKHFNSLPLAGAEFLRVECVMGGVVLKPSFLEGVAPYVRPLFMNPALGILFLIGRDSPPSFRRMLVTTARLARTKVKRPAPGVSGSRIRKFRDDGRKPRPPERRMRENTQVFPYKQNPTRLL